MLNRSSRNCVVSGYYCTIESNCYEVRIEGTDITVKSGSKYIEVIDCHNIIINSGSELKIQNVSNRIYWHKKDGWVWAEIKEMPKPNCTTS